MTTVRVVVADDQTVVREGLRSMLGQFDEVEVAGVAVSGEEAIDLVEELRPDVLLTDLRMPGIGGVAAIAELVGRRSPTRCVALTTYDDAETVLAALDAGALGFLNKDADPATIVDAVRSAAAGRSLLDAAAMAALRERATVPAPRSSSGDAPDGLTARELDVLTLVARGLANRQIATELFVSEATVKTHVNHLLSKTAARDRAGLVGYAYRHGLV